MKHLFAIILLAACGMWAWSELTPEQMYKLSYRLETGYGAPVDSVRADSLLRASAEAGYAPACNLLGYRYYDVDPDSMLMWIERAAMATPPEPKAFNNLGYLLSTGQGGVKKDLSKARYWYEKGASAGVAPAKASLAQMLLADSVCPDTLRAKELLRSAASDGFAPAAQELYLLLKPDFELLTPAQALSEGKEYYRQGIFAISAPLFMQALKSENPEAEAIALLAQSYATGRGVPYDYMHAMHLFYLAAHKGDPSAMYIVAEILEQFPDAFTANGESEDGIRTAAEWLEQAAASGVSDAHEALRRLDP